MKVKVKRISLGYLEEPQKGKKINKKSARKGRQVSGHQRDFILSQNTLDKMQENISSLKTKEFQKLKENYIASSITYEVSFNQFLLSSNAYSKEILKPVQEQNKHLIESHLTLSKTLENQKTRLLELEKQIKELISRKSPYLLNEISMPKFGTKDYFDPDHIKMFPVVSSDDDISIKSLFELLSEWGENIGLSEQGLKHAIFTRLRGKRAKAWLTYKKLSLREAIQNLICQFDKIESRQSHKDKINNFKVEIGEDIQNSTQRLLSSINKYLEYVRDEKEKLILRKELIKDKLNVLLSPRAYREVFRVIELRNQCGSEIGEKELLSLIHTESMFDQRTKEDQSYVQLNNISSIEHDTVDDSSNDSSYEINAIEHKRTFNESLDNKMSHKIPKMNDRKILVPSRKHDSSNPSPISPIAIGRNNIPYVTVNKPNPMNRFHAKNFGSDNSTVRPQNENRFRDIIRERNAPLRYDIQPSKERSYGGVDQNYGYPRYNRNREDYNQFRRRNSYPGNRQQYSDNNTQLRYNNYRQGKNNLPSGLKHNLQVRSNPPSIFQQITVDELNAICIECPKDAGEHTVSQCQRTQVFRKGPNLQKII